MLSLVKATLTILSGIVTVAALVPQKKITIWLIGDSTMSVKDPKTYPETGWGMPFVNFWDSTVKVDNRAMNGRSTRTFLEENRWAPVVESLQEGDYVFIQFGHNDEVPTKVQYTPPVDFMANLSKYIMETKARKAIPILLTPVARRKFDNLGNVVETHQEYATLVRTVAIREQVTLIDLDSISQQLLQQLGPAQSTLLYNHLQPGEHPNYPEGKSDDTHFNELGARKMAELVLLAIRRQIPGLAARIVKQKPK